MRKVDRTQLNSSYWAENEEMLKQPVYAQQIRQDRLTGREIVAKELKELTDKQQEDEQTKIRERQEAEEAKAREERAEFEEWKRQKAEIRDGNARAHNAHTQNEGSSLP